MIDVVWKWAGLLLMGVAVFLFTLRYNERFLDWLRFQSLGTRDFIVDRLNQMFITVSPEKVLLGLFALSVGSGSIVFLFFLPQVIPGLIFGFAATVVGWKAPKPIVELIYRRRVKKFTLQMIDGLSLMSNAMRSGLSVVQSIGVIVQEMPNPIREEFNLVLSETRLGVSLEEAMINLSKRIQSDDVEMFVTAINILNETGGNLAETFDTIVNTIRERVRVQSKIEAMTAQGFYQGVIVMAVPPILGLIFYSSDPEFMKPLFTTVLGWLIVSVIVALEVIGFFVIMRIIKIEV